MLVLAALIWGTAFVAQTTGMDHLGPYTFNGVRSLIGTAVLLPVILLGNRQRKKGLLPEEAAGSPAAQRKTLMLGGLGCGVLLCGGSLLQQVGLQYTSVGKAGFLTALYIVIVPILGIFLGRKTSLQIWLSVGVALVGTYFLSVTQSMTISSGDLLVIAGALFFSLHILLVDRLSHRVNGVRLSCLQFFVSGTISLALAFALEKPTWENVLLAWLPLVYTGVMSNGVAYTFQILGQQGTKPAVASLILSLESVFAAVAGWLLLGQFLSLRELAGCGLVFGAVILAQIPRNSQKKGAMGQDLGKGNSVQKAENEV